MATFARGDNCPVCGKALLDGLFDTTWRSSRERHERYVCGLEASLCKPCEQLYVDPNLVDMLALNDWRCVQAVASDAWFRQARL
jgi:hypothetical protein